MDYLELLANRVESQLTDNRLTSIGLEFGGGSLNYWDGSWDNNEYVIPYQLENIMGNRDGELELYDSSGEKIQPRLFEQTWRPDRTVTRFLIPHCGWIEQIRWLDQDVAGVRLRFHHTNLKPLRLEVRWSGDRSAGERVAWEGRRGILFRDRGRLAGVWRIFAADDAAGCLRESRTNRGGWAAQIAVRSEGTMLHAFWSLGMDRTDAVGRLRRIQADPAASLQRAAARWQRFFERQVPHLEGVPEWLRKQYYLLYSIQRANVFAPLGGPLKRAYACPGKFRLLPQWFWDSAFHSISEKWLRGFPATEGNLLNLVESRTNDGRMAFTLDVKGFTFERILGRETIQPFILPIAVWDIFLQRGSLAWLRKTLPGLVAFDRWMERRRGTPDGLICVRHGGETGWDNSVRFVLKAYDRDAVGTVIPPGLAPADFNAYVLIGRERIARMAELVGQPSLAAEYRVRAKTMAQALRALWNPRQRIFADRLPGGRLSPVVTPGGMIPLLAGAATAAQARASVGLLTDQRQFWSHYPIPTLSMADARFTDEDVYSSYWNGRTWLNINWLVAEGLMRYGFRRTAAELIRRTLEMISATGMPQSLENYHPRQKYRYEFSHNCFWYGWSGLANDLLLRRILGIQPRLDRRRLELAPLWMDGLQEAQVSNLQVGRHNVTLEYRREPRRAIRIRVAGAPGLIAVAGGRETRLARNGATVRVRAGENPGRHWLAD